MTPLKAIRAFCVECCGGNARWATECTSTKCALWQFRTGHASKGKREMTEEQRQATAERLKKAREAKNLL